MTREEVLSIIRRAQPCTAQQIKAIASSDKLEPMWDDELLHLLDQMVSDGQVFRNRGNAISTKWTKIGIDYLDLPSPPPVVTVYRLTPKRART